MVPVSPIGVRLRPIASGLTAPMDRGSRVPELRGRYVRADLSGVLFVADLKARRLEKLLSKVGFFIKGIGQEEHNELYLLGPKNIGPSGSNGVIMAIDSLGDRDEGDDGDGGGD